MKLPHLRSLVILGALALGAALVAFAAPRPRAAAAQSQNPLLGIFGARLELRGVVAQILPAGSYRYARLRLPDGGEAWLVTLGECPPVGSAVVARSLGQRRDFQSARLGRRFPLLHFGVLRSQ